MIRLKNIGQYLAEVFIPGNASTGVKGRVTVPFRSEIAAIFAVVGAAGTTGSMVIDVNRRAANGAATTVFNGATKISFASAATVATYAAVLAAQKAFEAGDEVEVEVDSIHSTPAVATKVYVLFEARNAPDVVSNQHPSALLK